MDAETASGELWETVVSLLDSLTCAEVSPSGVLGARAPMS
jgi:hypothetical protein